jgi:hypothetical protein
VLFIPVRPPLSALPAAGMAPFGKFFKGRHFILIEPVMKVGAFEVDGGLGRTAYIERETEFVGHFFTSGH